jgi:hypothetical protein
MREKQRKKHTPAVAEPTIPIVKYSSNRGKTSQGSAAEMGKRGRSLFDITYKE